MLPVLYYVNRSIMVWQPGTQVKSPQKFPRRTIKSVPLELLIRIHYTTLPYLLSFCHLASSHPVEKTINHTQACTVQWNMWSKNYFRPSKSNTITSHQKTSKDTSKDVKRCQKTRQKMSKGIRRHHKTSKDIKRHQKTS